MIKFPWSVGMLKLHQTVSNVTKMSKLFETVQIFTISMLSILQIIKLHQLNLDIQILPNRQSCQQVELMLQLSPINYC